jgi:hypothetical protein
MLLDLFHCLMSFNPHPPHGGRPLHFAVVLYSITIGSASHYFNYDNMLALFEENQDNTVRKYSAFKVRLTFALTAGVLQREGQMMRGSVTSIVGLAP